MSHYELFPDVLSIDFSIPSLTLENIFKEFPKLKDLGLMPKYLSSPPFVMWDITYKCNSRCIYCYNASPKEVDELTLDESMKIAEQIVRAKCFSVCLTGGEPTLRFDLQIALAKYLHSHGVAVSTITNGWLVDENIAKELAKYLSLVQVSLDGASPEVHDKMRGVPGLFERAVNAIKLFHKHGIKSIAVSFACTKSNINDFPNMIDLCRELKVKQLRTMPLVPTGRALHASLEPTQAEYKKLISFIDDTNRKIGEEGGELKLEWGEPSGHVKIGLLFGYVVGVNIKANGFVGFSPYLPYVFGNLRKESLSRIWLKGLRNAWHIPIVRRNVRKINEAADFAKPWEKTEKDVDIEPTPKPMPLELMRELDSFPRVSRTIRWRMDGETEELIIFSSPKLRSYCLFNPVAAKIFFLCDGFHTVEQMIDIVSHEYPRVPKDRIQKDVTQFVKKIKELGLLE